MTVVATAVVLDWVVLVASASSVDFFADISFPYVPCGITLDVVSSP